MAMNLHVGFKAGKTPFPNNPSRCLQKQCKVSTATVLCCSSSAFGKQRDETTFYDLLSLDASKNLGMEEIKKAYRRKVLQYHPDVCPPSKKEESTKNFLELHKAYQTLSDPILREMYDRELGLVGSTAKTEKSICQRQVWEDQLLELQRRSDIKTKNGGKIQKGAAPQESTSF